jgi:hypothetical protein
MTTVSPTAGEQLTALRAAVDGLLSADLSLLARDELLGVVRGFETESRRLVAVQHRLVAEVQDRNVAGELRYRDTAGLLSELLLLTRGQATARVAAADSFGPRRSLAGETLAPRLPAAAAAVAEGAISPAHATVIANTIEALPGPVRAAHAGSADALLTEHATGLTTRQLSLAADRILAFLHPDGTLTPDRVHEQDRDLVLRRNPDGSGDWRAHLTPACLALWETVLAPLARKRPDDGCGPDTRTPGQRQHDALEDAAKRLLMTGELPSTAGIATTLLISMTLDQLEARAGQATTHHGGTLSIDQALRLAAGGKALPIVLGEAGGVLAYGRGRRLASEGQRLALMARDRGCTFPDCIISAARSEVHHIVDWAKGGTTDLDSLALACGWHNNHAPRHGWVTVMINDVPHWIPPPHIDPDQRPQRNRMHRC